MTLIKWGEELSTGVGFVDSEHKMLVNMINELNDAMLEQHGKDVVGRIITRMAAYAKTHFAHEEKEMLACSFSGYKAHKKEHDDFIDKVADLKQELDEGRIMVTTDTMKFLKSWLTSHILVTDKLYVDSFVSHGVH
ncbi:MAG: hemerythrin family protein [Planctomycetales bacterium]|nr:hemerythrin family protein [bacterium]UNM08521.1 MAG: hemerythrin family protein [Planctomycetales bacterium]